jgi:hypothetical protein
MANINDNGTSTGTGTEEITFVGENKMITEHCQYGFPGNKSFLDFIQDNLISNYLQQLVIGIFGAETGIISGCRISGNSVSSGTVLINGILLPFAGGVRRNYVKVTDSVEQATFEDNNNYDAYKKAIAEFTDTNTGISWTTLNSNRLNVVEKLLTLQTELQELKSDFLSHSHTTTGGGGVIAPQTQ